jgi:integrase
VDVDLDAREVSVVQQITPVHYTPITTTLKTDAGQRTIPLDKLTTQALRDHQDRRNRWRKACGSAWPDTRLFFTTPTGQPWHPSMVSHRFTQLIDSSRLPPIRLHDLRHCAATYLRAAGADLKTIQETLGHADLNITADTYTSVLVELERATAEAAAGLIPRNRHSPTGTDNPPEEHDSR